MITKGIKHICIAMAFVCTCHAAEAQEHKERVNVSKATESITLGGGCFWCIEATFQTFRGIESVESGYAGGSTENPSYEQVSAGVGGHAEVVRVNFNQTIISLPQILTIFFHAHDPTTKDRQGNDVGPQYRSIILHENEAQRLAAEEVKAELDRQGLWGSAPIVTEIVPLKVFYRAEEYHQNYYRDNPSKGYCSLVIAPKLQKLRKQFHDWLK